MLFTVHPADAVPHRISSKPGQVHLIRDKWNDWHRFITQFYLVVFDMDGNRHGVGSVKIGQFGMETGLRSPAILEEFDALDDQFFSSHEWQLRQAAHLSG